jgi:hypothetical protein
LNKLKSILRETDFYYYERDLPINERCWDIETAEKEPTVMGKITGDGNFRMGEYEFNSKGAFDEYVKFMKEVSTEGIEDYERLSDILTDERIASGKQETLASDLEYKKVMSKVFKYLNVAEGYELDVNNPEDIKEFYINIQPKKMAETLASIHNKGLSHKYPGRLNWLAVGYLIDLDSVSGEMLGDAPVTGADIKKDLYRSVDALYHYEERNETILDPDSKEADTTFHGFVSQMLGRTEAIKMTDKAARTFFSTYAKARGFDDNWIRNIPNLGKNEKG